MDSCSPCTTAAPRGTLHAPLKRTCARSKGSRWLYTIAAPQDALLEQPLRTYACPNRSRSPGTTSGSRDVPPRAADEHVSSFRGQCCSQHHFSTFQVSPPRSLPANRKAQTAGVEPASLEHLRVSLGRCNPSWCIIPPRAAVGRAPLQDLQVAGSSGALKRALTPRATVRAEPMHHPKVTPPGGVCTYHLVPRAIVGLAPLQHFQYSV